MGCQDQYLPGIQQVDLVASVPIAVTGTVAITFPTTTVPVTQNVNGKITLNSGASTQLLAANANRKNTMITNLSGSTLYIAFGVAATANHQQIPNGSSFALPIDAQGNQFQGAINGFQNSGGALDFLVLEFN